MRLIDVPADARLTFVCEKPSQAENYASAWHKARPDAHPPLFIGMRSLIGAQTVIPRNIAYDSLPKFLDPTWKRLKDGPSVFSWLPDPLPAPVIPEDTSYIDLLRIKKAGRLVKDPVSIDDALKSADHIVYACDSDARGAGIFSRFIQTRLGLSSDARAFPVVLTNSESSECLKEAFGSGLTTRSPEFQTLFRRMGAREAFYFNWALNALPIFGDVLRHIEAPGDAFLSKFQILVLYALSSRDPMTENEIFRMMVDWKGSGKWQGKAWHGIGSASSRMPIIEQLTKKGLIQVCNPREAGVHRKLKISDLGKTFLSHVHPDCYDPDIGFRIDNWGGDWPTGRPAMERYIRTYFGKQKRFFAKSRR